jgi:hypothetical protein
MSEKPDQNFMKELLLNNYEEKLLDFMDEITHKVGKAESAKLQQQQRAELDDEYESESEYENYDNNVPIVKSTEEWDFRTRIGSHLDLANPALEFVKFLLEVFSLENSLHTTCVILKRNLLKKLAVGEFTKEARYVEPSLQLVLPMVTCHVCLISNNIDLC